MKRFFVLVFLFASLVTFSGCSGNGFSHSLDEDNVVNSLPDSFSLVTSAHQFEEELSFNAPSLFLGDTPQQFRDYLLSNKIDIAMQKEGETLFTTQEINDWVAKYHAIWINEMSIIYDNLLNILNDDAREFLGYSQVSWERMNDYNSYLWYEIFSMSTGRGTGDASMILYQNLQRVRERVFLLAEYYYWLTGGFSFSQRDI